MNLSVIYEDNHLLVVDKPAGLLTQPNGSDPNSLEEVCKAYIREKTQKPGNIFLHALHRLDRSVSGVVLFAKTSKALSRLNESLRNKDAAKKYIALLDSLPQQQEGVLEHYLLHDEFCAKVVQPTHPKAKKARLSYKVVHDTIEIYLDTGRYHQIRVQFAAIGCPIVGDSKYGSAKIFASGAIALHHAALTVVHPVTKESMTFTSPLPPPLQKVRKVRKTREDLTG